MKAFRSEVGCSLFENQCSPQVTHYLTRWDARRSSRFRGVQFQRSRKGDPLWKAVIRHHKASDNNRIFLGLFSSEEEAAAVYDFALISLGEEPVNSPLSYYQSTQSDLLQRLDEVSLKVTGEPYSDRFQSTMPITPKHHDIIRIDEDGKTVLGILISSVLQRAWIYEDDYLRIRAKYGIPGWNLNGNGRGRSYVRFKTPKTKVTTTVARLVAGDIYKTVVKPKDGDPFNLRADNLYHDDGAGGCPKRRRSMKVVSDHTVSETFDLPSSYTIQGGRHV